MWRHKLAHAGGGSKLRMLARTGKRRRGLLLEVERRRGLAREQAWIMHGSGRKARNNGREALRKGEREDFVVGSSHLVVAAVAVHGFAVHTHAAGSIKDFSPVATHGHIY